MTWENAGNANLGTAARDAWQGSGGARWPGRRSFKSWWEPPAVRRTAHLRSQGERCLESLWLNPPTLAPSSPFPSAFWEPERAWRGQVEIRRRWGQEDERQRRCCLLSWRGTPFATLQCPRRGQDFERETSFHALPLGPSLATKFLGLAATWVVGPAHRENLWPPNLRTGLHPKL